MFLTQCSSYLKKIISLSISTKLVLFNLLAEETSSHPSPSYVLALTGRLEPSWEWAGVWMLRYRQSSDMEVEGRVTFHSSILFMPLGSCGHLVAVAGS